jgi:hypothetical protein
MKLTNKFNLPLPIYNAILWQEAAHKSNANISCTTLIDSPLKFWLRSEYYDRIEEDASERLWALYGSLVHLVAEKHGATQAGAHVERQVFSTIKGWKVSAIIDHILEDDVISDYKFTSCWATRDGVKAEWEAQLNVGLWLLRHSEDSDMVELGNTIKRLQIVALFRDWVPSNIDRFPNQVQVLPVSVWSDDKARSYIEERVALHQEALATVQRGSVPDICSDQERWMSDFAICAKSKKIALKAKIPTREEAEDWLVKLGGDYIREATPRRCESYCTYAKCGLCPWYDYEHKLTRTEPIVPMEIQMNSNSTATDPDHQRKAEPSP